MEVTLKKVKTFDGREGIGLNADVYVNGEKCFYFLDDASGGESHHYPFNKELYQQLKDYAASLPKEKVTGTRSDFEIQPDIDTLVNKAFEAYELEKSDKRMMKKTDTKVIFSSGDGQYAFTSWGNLGIKTVATNYPEKIKDALNKMRVKYPGWKLMNTNIPAELLN
jgi:hypothetical protein